MLKQLLLPNLKPIIAGLILAILIYISFLFFVYGTVFFAKLLNVI